MEVLSIAIVYLISKSLSGNQLIKGLALQFYPTLFLIMKFFSAGSNSKRTETIYFKGYKHQKNSVSYTLKCRISYHLTACNRHIHNPCLGRVSGKQPFKVTCEIYFSLLLTSQSYVKN